MKLKSFKTDRFAGIRDREVTFQDGLNVILGPNEAGKSTLVEAIFATIFKDPKLRLNLAVDKEFKERFMPYPEGDYINGILEFKVSGKSYRLKKEWGDSHSVSLELPDSSLLKNSSKIKEYLNELFLFGQATYGNVVFARQYNVKEAIQRIVSDDSIINTVSSFLRKTVMELEGISIEKLRDRISEELAELTKRWDLINKRPDNPNRDINNPYRVGYGKIYGAYLKKATIERQMEETREIEKNFAGISEELKELEEEREKVIDEITELARLEGDIFKRASIEPEVKRLEEKSVLLKKINSQWPLKEDRFKRVKKELEDLDKAIELLKEDKILAKKKAELERKIELLNRVEKLKEKLEGKKEELVKLQRISSEDIEEMERLDSRLKKNEALLQASRLIARINKASGEVFVTRGVGEKERVTPGREIKADAYLHIQVGDQLDIEIESAEINFTELKKKYQDCRERLEKKLNCLNITEISKAKLARERYKDLSNEIKNLGEQIENLLGEKSYQDLKEEIESLAEIKLTADLEEIEKELEEKNNSRTELLAEGRTLTEQLGNWQEEYGQPDSLLDVLVDIQVKVKSYQKELEELAKLPENYQSAEEFKDHLLSLRDKKDKLDETINEKKEELAEITAMLPDESYEELAVIQKDYETEYNKLLKRVEDLLKVQKVVEKKLEEMDDDSFLPLGESFSNYLNILTAGKYQLGKIDEDFKLEIKGEDYHSLPVDINFLSYGTYDGVALAFRFALIEQLFENEGFIILDDCLVNLDPERKRAAIKLINKFSKDYQLIFTTCNPETARELGGNIIELSA